MENLYHQFLIRHRIYCEHFGCLDTLNKASTVINLNGRDLVVCDEHNKRMTAARKSDNKQGKTFRDYEPELKYGTATDIQEHIRYGGSRENY